LDDLAECCKFCCRSCDNKDTDLEFEWSDLLWTNLLPTSSCRLLCNFSFAFLQIKVNTVKQIIQILHSALQAQLCNHEHVNTKTFYLNSGLYLASNFPFIYILERKSPSLCNKIWVFHCTATRTIYNILYFRSRKPFSDFLTNDSLCQRRDKIYFTELHCQVRSPTYYYFVLGSYYKAQIHFLNLEILIYFLVIQILGFM
jgi:hypothetical protein